ncbi:MAG: 6-phosphofructokinase [Oscillospiraceae bacterium]|nr:6-phosphofructokinase [Oscillospiraceae bacterium]
MDILKGACVFGQSGGPTSVINASFYGAVKAALADPRITAVYGAAHGIKGILNDVLYDISAEDPNELELLPNTPSSALGSCRYKLADPDKDDTDYKRLLGIFRKYDIRYFFYNGGNDSMDTCEKVSRYMARSGWDCRVIGIPKTIDNDLGGTDHCPGFGSAARYIATSCMEISLDASVYDYGQVTIVEIMGRHAGWLTASAALAAHFGAGPDLIYLPEKEFELDAFLDRVSALLNDKGSAFIAVSEGIHDKNGTFISEYASGNGAKDAFGHTQLGGLASFLAAKVKERTGAKTRGIELSLLQRCGAHLASRTDIDEAVMAGRAAVEAAVNGESGKMVAFRREEKNGGYACGTVLVPLSEAANFEKKVPEEWILPDGSGVTQEMIDYILPLIQGENGRAQQSGLPRFARLAKVRAKK